VLTKISLAFSNGDEKSLTLADKILQQGKEIFEWLQAGASLYLCGEKEPAGKAIEEALLKVFSIETGSEANGNVYFETLKKENRYAKDLY
jgi:sulfite reductase (NADPH) flavoprotein alpha-component